MHSFSQLVAVFEEKFINPLPFPKQPGTLYEPCRYLLQLGGKRIRPVLCLMGNEIFGEITKDAWHAANAIELFHNFTLIHDDIMDRAPLRRGQPTIHEKYGMTAGILGGDVMCIFSYEQLALINSHLQQVLHFFNKTAIEVCEGQQLDMDYEKRNDVSIDEYLHMITLKTSVLLAGSLKIGAFLGGATEGNANKLYHFGKNLGIAFQLQDDYLDAFGDTEKLGKQNGGDIKANKKTYLLLKALENASDIQRKDIETLLAADHEDKVTDMLSIYRSARVDEHCQELAGVYAQKAFNCLEDVAATGKRKQPVYEVATYLLQRDK